MNIRIIPRLDIKGPNLVKGVHFEGLRVLGRPERFARHYYESGADELIYLDAVASLYSRSSLLEIVERTSRDIFIPLCVGGGLRSIDDIRAVLRAGADKVSLNTAAVGRPELIREASRTFGSSTIVVSIEAVRQSDGSYQVMTDFGREQSGLDALQWAMRAAELGAGELMVTSIDREGTGRGFDLQLTRRIAEAVPIPVIAAGGAGTTDHVAEAVIEGRADAVCVASILHYAYARTRTGAAGEFAEEGNLEYLKQARPFGCIRETTLEELKRGLLDRGIGCRIGSALGEHSK
jgi:imidazole glycerol-phosphate synthase subunit HisF